MTREEAVKWLNVERELIVEIPQDNSAELKEAYDLAIKALEKQPSDDCISRADAVNRILKQYEYHQREFGEKIAHDYLAGLSNAADYIRELPSFTPKQKKGKWVKGIFAGLYVCSECEYVEDGKPKYCAGCGCQMDGDKEDSE